MGAHPVTIYCTEVQIKTQKRLKMNALYYRQDTTMCECSAYVAFNKADMSWQKICFVQAMYAENSDIVLPSR